MYVISDGLGAAPISTVVETSVGAGLLMAAPFTGPAAPFVALAGGVADLLAAVGVGTGCGQSCITASQYADKAQAILYQNLQAYMAVPTPRPKSIQAAALANFDQTWSGYEQACASVPGQAGLDCVSARQAGACHYQANGECWNWFVGFRDPIANDPNVVPDDQAVSGGSALTPSSVTGVAASVSSWWPYLAVAAGVFAVWKLS